jgi:hypothetical protein
MPDWISDKQNRLAKIRKAKEAVEAEAADRVASDFSSWFS